VVHFGRNFASERFLYTSRIVKRDVYASYQRSYSDHNYGQLKMQLEIRILQKKKTFMENDLIKMLIVCQK
jgi:hypothetical protein